MDFDQTQSSSFNNNPVATYSDPQHRASLPVTINLNPDHNSQSGNHQGSVTIPLGQFSSFFSDSFFYTSYFYSFISLIIIIIIIFYFFFFTGSNVTRIGDKISVNIDLRLADLQHLKQKQQNDHPDWSGLDPLDRHIRKLERSIDQVRVIFIPWTFSTDYLK